MPADAATSERAAVVPAAEHLPIPADARWCDVRVVDAATGDGVAGAEVVWLYTKDGVLPWHLLRALPPDEQERFSRELVCRGR